MKYLNKILLLAIAATTLLQPVQVTTPLPPYPLLAARAHTPTSTVEAITVGTIFGPITVNEPVLVELILHPAMERLKNLDQHGPTTYFGKKPTFSRYTHSLGVFAILRMKGCSLKEQIAGLLHDVSHTAFSHTADHLFKTGNQVAYQDTIHAWFLEKMHLDKVLERHGFTIADVMPDNPEFKGLKQKHPNLCADRIEYIIHTGIVYGKISQEKGMAMGQSLHFEDGKWFFDNLEDAKTMAELSLFFTLHKWSNHCNLAWHHWLCAAIERGFALKLFTSDDLHFGPDQVILDALYASSDEIIKETLKKCYEPKKHYKKVRDDSHADLHDMPKLRCVDPLIKRPDDTAFSVVSDYDANYKARVEAVRKKFERGLRLVFVENA